MRQQQIEGRFLAPDGIVRIGEIVVEDGVISRCAFGDEAGAEDGGPGADGVIVPGFVDVHLHGAAGADVMDATPEALDAIAAAVAARGTTSWLATTLTHTYEQTERAVDAVAAYMKSGRNGRSGAAIAGLHLEGPFLNVKYRGAQNEAHIRLPDCERFADWCERSGGAVRMITLAPELEGAEALVREAVRRGVVVSAGHTDATWADMERAERWGVSHLTHLFNAMRPLHHREPGLIGYAMRHPTLTADLIADGVHLHPGIVDTALAQMGPGRLLLITDAMRAACMGDGQYDLGGLRVAVTGGVARLGDGSLAGSLLTMDRAFRRIVTMHGVPLADAARMAAGNPAALLGLSDRLGSIAEGYAADLVCLDGRGAVVWTMVGGRYVHRNPEACPDD